MIGVKLYKSTAFSLISTKLYSFSSCKCGGQDSFHALSHSQCTVLGSLHDFALTGSLIVDAAEMEYAVDDGAMQLLIVFGGKLLAIAPHGVEADEEVATDDVALGVVEGDDVGVVVVLQELAVDLEDTLVVAEDVAHVAHLLAIGGGYGAYPCGGLALLDGWHHGAFGVVGNHVWLILNFEL